MKGVDTNLLVYAHRADTPQHFIAQRVLRELAESGDAWFIPWPCAYEFTRIVTHPKVFNEPSSRRTAIDVLSALRLNSGAQFLGHGPAHDEKFASLSEEGGASGNLWFDVQIAAILLEHGIPEIITNDNDFLRFKDLRVINPFES